MSLQYESKNAKKEAMHMHCFFQRVKKVFLTAEN